MAEAAPPLAGHASVEDSARLIRNYRYAVERMMRILGGWLALTPELSAKLVMGRHVWDNAQHADALGKRLPELRARAHESEPSSPAFVAFMDALEEPERPHQTIERLVGIYRVLKPHLLASYEDHLARVNPVYEPPTERLLLGLAEVERRHIAAGERIIVHLATTTALEERAAAWQRRLGGMLETAGGVTGGGMPAARATSDARPPRATLNEDAAEFIRLERAVSGWPIPDELQTALEALGDALIAGDAVRVRRWLGAGVAWDGEAALAPLDLSAHRPVAFAKIGRQRIVKLRLDGARGHATVVGRWVPGPEGWRLASLDLSSTEPAQRA